jgi:hypothetical protein
MNGNVSTIQLLSRFMKKLSIDENGLLFLAEISPSGFKITPGKSPSCAERGIDTFRTIHKLLFV